MPQPPEVEALSADLRALYQRAWTDILARQDAIAADLQSRKAERLARMRELQADVERLTAQADEQARAWVAKELPRAYQLGATQAAAGFTWSTPHVDAVTLLAQETYDDLLAASTHVRRTTRTFIKAAARTAVERTVAGGQTAQAAARAAARSLIEEHGIHSVVYSNGARHGLAEYTSLAVRTKSAVAYNVGTFNQLGAVGIEYAECLDNPSCGLSSHQDSRKANGLVLPLSEARQYPISHINCVRAWSGRPEITSPEQAKAAKPSTTEAQRADQAAVEAERETAVRRRANTKARRTSAAERRTAKTEATAARRAARAVRPEPRSPHPQIDALPRRKTGAEVLGDPTFVEDPESILNNAIQYANPGYGQPGYDVNCVHVVNTVEMRRRGYDVSATPLPEHIRALQRGRNGQDALNRWRTPEGGTRDFTRSHYGYLRARVDEWPPGARGWIVTNHKAGSHIFNVEKLESGQIAWSDGQNGDPFVDIYEILAEAIPGRTWLHARVDDLTPTDDILEFMTPGG